jgi:hypothetical protein
VRNRNCFNQGNLYVVLVVLRQHSLLGYLCSLPSVACNMPAAIADELGAKNLLCDIAVSGLGPAPCQCCSGAVQKPQAATMLAQLCSVDHECCKMLNAQCRMVPFCTCIV